MVTDQSVKRQSRALLPALLCDTVGGSGLVLVGVGAYIRSGLLPLILIGALLGLAALPGLILSAVALRHWATHRWCTACIATAVVASGITAVLIGPAVLILSWNAAPNAAAVLATRFEHEVETLGARQLCSNGDAGRGPDNFSPWRESYVLTHDDGKVLPRLQRQATAAGFSTLTRQSGRTSSFPDSRRFSATRHASSDEPAATLTVEISPSGTQLNCGPEYGRTYRADSGDIVIDLSTSIDPTTRRRAHLRGTQQVHEGLRLTAPRFRWP